MSSGVAKKRNIHRKGKGKRVIKQAVSRSHYMDSRRRQLCRTY